MRDLRVEQRLTTAQIPWEFLSGVPWTDIYSDEEICRQIRLDKGTDPEVIDSYALAMMDGVDFTAIIVVGEKPPYAIVAGLHRQAAAELAERLLTDVYRLLTDDVSVAERIRRTDNAGNGTRQSKEDMTAQGMYMVREQGMSVEQAAHECHLRSEYLAARLRADRVRLDLLRMQVDPRQIAKLSHQHLVALHPIERASLRAQVAQILPDLTVPERQQLIKDVREAATDEQAAAALGQAREYVQARKAKTGGGKYKPPKTGLDQLPGLLMRIDRTIEGWTGKTLGQMSKAERTGLSQRCQQTVDRLERLVGVLDDESKGQRAADSA